MMGSRVAAGLALVASLPACVGLLSMTVELDGRDATVEFGGGDDAARLEAIAYDFIVAEAIPELVGADGQVCRSSCVARRLAEAMAAKQDEADAASRLYAEQSQRVYDDLASRHAMEADGTVTADVVVGLGTFYEHNAWPDMALLWEGLDEHATRAMVALDFGTGPGRNMEKWHERFARVDGVDIAKTNLENADRYLRARGVADYRLYHCDGRDLANVPSGFYDVVFSTIVMQHITFHSIRYHLFEEFYRVLRCGGRISKQMGFGPSVVDPPITVDYHNDLRVTDAHDTRVEDPDDLRRDLEAIGYVDFRYRIRPSGPGAERFAGQWIFFQATKPRFAPGCPTF